MPSTSITKTVKQFRQLIEEVFAGDAKAAEAMGDLWSSDCVLEMHGPEPMKASFHGRSAVQVYFKNLAGSVGAKVSLPGGGAGRLKTERFSVDETEILSDKAVLAWHQVLDHDGKAVLFKGQTTLSFRDGKITSSDTVVVDAPAAAPGMLRAGLQLQKLKVMDIGRLALAAWAVV